MYYAPSEFFCPYHFVIRPVAREKRAENLALIRQVSPRVSRQLTIHGEGVYIQENKRCTCGQGCSITIGSIPIGAGHGAVVGWLFLYMQKKIMYLYKTHFINTNIVKI